MSDFTVEIDYEDIPFVFDESASCGQQPSEEELAVITATLSSLYPYQSTRLWGLEGRLSAISNRLKM